MQAGFSLNFFCVDVFFAFVFFIAAEKKRKQADLTGIFSGCSRKKDTACILACIYSLEMYGGVSLLYSRNESIRST